MRDTKSVPKDNILIFDTFLAVRPDRHAGVIPTLVGEFTGSPELPILILGHPNRPRREYATLVVEGVRAHHEHLARRRVQLVPDWLAGDGVDVVGIDDPVRPGLAYV